MKIIKLFGWSREHPGLIQLLHTSFVSPIDWAGGPGVPNWITREIGHYERAVRPSFEIQRGDQMPQHLPQWYARADFRLSDAIARELFYFVSFIYDHPVVSFILLISSRIPHKRRTVLSFHCRLQFQFIIKCTGNVKTT